MVRLVKGAYWDTEVKRAQERGLADYPVFTRKAMTDLCYLACASKLLAARPRLYPQFATHNALTVASVIEAAGGVEGYEFQRLHGMGEALYEALLPTCPAPPAASTRRSAAIAICSPIWCAGCSRTARTPPSSPLPPIPQVPIAAILRAAAGCDRHAGATPGIGKFRCRATSMAGAAQFRRASSSAIARRLDALLAEVRAGVPPSARGGAADRRHRIRRTSPRGALADRRHGASAR